MTKMLLNLLQTIFLANGDDQLITHMAHAFLIFGVAQSLYSLLADDPAPYGRYGAKSTWPRTWTVRADLGWFLQESPALMVPLCILAFACSSAAINKVILGCFVIHYLHRAFIYPLYISNGTPIRWFIVALAILYCIFNGFMQGYYLLCLAEYPPDYHWNLNFILGITLFVSGLVINIHSDHILINLRKPGKITYKIPRGGLFEYVSCANYFGEILEWCGYALAAWCYPATAFAFFTTVFLGIRATYHHRFYLRKFKHYPSYRKAVIPFVI